MGLAEAFAELFGDPTPTRDLAAIKDAYRRLRTKRHPDHGGTPDSFRVLQAAYETAEAYALTPKLCEICQGVGTVEVFRGFSKSRLHCEACTGTGQNALWGPNAL